LFAGGGTFYNRVDIWNSETKTWNNSTLSQGRTFLSATSVGKYAVFRGGLTGSSLSNVVDIWNSETNSWSVSSLSQARYWLSATSVGNYALFGGGEVSGGGTCENGVSDVVDILDITSMKWELKRFIQPRRSPMAAALSNLALFGGGNGSPQVIIGACHVYPTLIEMWNSTSNSMSTVAMSQIRVNFAAAAAGDYVLFGGGCFDNHPPPGGGGSNYCDQVTNTVEYVYIAPLMEIATPPDENSPPDEKSNEIVIAVTTVAVILIITAIISITGFLIYRRKKASHHTENSSFEMISSQKSSIILIDVTVKGLIGKGAFAEVFLGTSKGQEVALKNIYSTNKNNIETDINTLMYVFHREFTHIFIVLFDIKTVSDSLDCMYNQTIHLT
jgi:hypothetical protein